MHNHFHVFADGGVDPSWVGHGGPEPEFASCLIYLDYGDDVNRIAPLLRLWHEEASRLLLPFIEPPGDAEAGRSLSAYEENSAGRGRRRRLQRWSDGLTDDLFQISERWFDAPPAAVVSELDLYLSRFARRRHIKLQASVGFENRAGGLPQVLPALVELAHRIGEGTDSAYGEIVVNASTLAPATMLDSALNRSADESAEASRGQLRGYEWVTLCPGELVARLGGVEALRATGAFAEVRPFAHGGALLRATDAPDDYRDDRVRAVFRALAPVLPPGRPRELPGYDLSRVVFADPSQPGVRLPGAGLELGPALSPRDRVRTEALAALGTGWRPA